MEWSLFLTIVAQAFIGFVFLAILLMVLAAFLQAVKGEK